MASNLTVETGNGDFGALEDWSIRDDATPTIIGELSGSSVGDLSASTRTVTNSHYLNNNDILFSDPDAGDFYGTVDSTTVTKTTTSITAGGLLAATNITVTAPPLYDTSTLFDAYTTYLSLCFETAPAIDYQATNNPVVAYPAWTGVAWDFLRNLGAATDTEIAVVNGVIVVRDIGAVEQTINTIVDSGVSLTPSSQSLAKLVGITAQNTSSVATVGANIYNYASNPSLETNATNWAYSVSVGTNTTPAVRSSSSGAYVGTFAYRSVVTASVVNYTYPNRWKIGYTVNYTHTGSTMPYTDGPVNFGIGIYYTHTGGVGGYVQPTGILKVRWGDAADLLILEETLSSTLLTAGAFTYITGTSTNMPTNAVKAALYVTVNHFNVYIGSLTAPTSLPITIAVDGALISPQTTSYFDGSSGGGASWVGSANNSTSFKANPDNVSMYDALLDNNNVISVAAGEKTTVILNTVNSPAILGDLEPTNTVPIVPGQYIVSASDNLQVVAAEWLSYGGSVEAVVGTEANTIELTITGPPTTIPGVPGPYSLAVSDGTNSYATLNIAGAGVIRDPETIYLHTGASTQQELGPVVDIPFIETVEQARDRGRELAGYYGGPQVQISFELSTAEAAGLGLTQGSVVSWNDNKYRIISTTYTKTGVQVTAIARPSGSDLDDVWGGQASSAFDTVWAGFNGNDFAVNPLRSS